MRAIKLTKPGGLDNLKLAEIEVVEPQCGEIRIRNYASSLNFHDYVVALGLRMKLSKGDSLVSKKSCVLSSDILYMNRIKHSFVLLLLSRSVLNLLVSSITRPSCPSYRMSITNVRRICSMLCCP